MRTAFHRTQVSLYGLLQSHLSFPSPAVARYHSGQNGSSILHPFGLKFNKEKTKYTRATYISLLSLERRLDIPEVSLTPCVGEDWRMLHRQVVLSQLRFAWCVRPSRQTCRWWYPGLLAGYGIEQSQGSSVGIGDFISKHLGFFFN